MNTLTQTAYEAARELYRGEGLALPPVAAALKDQLQALNDRAFASRPLGWTLYDLDYFVHELQTGRPVDDYVALGLAGHGLNLQAVHYHAVGERCAIFLQQRWGTPQNEPAEDRARHDAMLRLAQRLQKAVAEKHAAGSWPHAQRLIVLDSSFHASRWCWQSTTSPSPAHWHHSANSAMAEAMLAVHAL